MSEITDDGAWQEHGLAIFHIDPARQQQ